MKEYSPGASIQDDYAYYCDNCEARRSKKLLIWRELPDRRGHFASENIHVFHFTGTEIHTQPFRVAAEIIAYLVPWLKNDYRRIYDPALFDEKWDE